MPTHVAAVDCGATSVRVCRVDLAAPTLEPEVVHRIGHAPVADPKGHLRWDWATIIAAIEDGLTACLALGPLASIGVDTWAVDYGLLDDDGELIGSPYSYRDHRTDGYLNMVNEFGAAEMYRINGLQLQPFNTVFQLGCHDQSELERASRLLWLPELIVHHLTGVTTTERTSAGSSGLIDVSTGDWSPELLDIAHVTSDLFAPIERAGHVVGEWRGVPVALVGGHDTASAVAGMGLPSSGGSAFVASGTWMLAGIERTGADTSDWARQRNFTNEAGALDGFRFLRNVTGFWLFERCRTSWADRGIDATDIEALLAAAEVASAAVPLVNVDDEQLRAPDDMLAAYTALAGLPIDSEPGVVTRSIIESIVHRTAEVLDEIATVSKIADIILFGGAARMQLLARRLSESTGLPVRTGSAEAAALGNAVVQGVAIREFSSLADGRSKIPTSEE